MICSFEWDQLQCQTFYMSETLDITLNIVWDLICHIYIILRESSSSCIYYTRL